MYIFYAMRYSSEIVVLRPRRIACLAQRSCRVRKERSGCNEMIYLIEDVALKEAQNSRDKVWAQR